MTKDSLKRFAVVDLEATGASSSASIIQIGIVIIEDNKIVTTYETDINPHEKLSEHIKQLTGITDHQLSKAPEFSQVAREIYHLLEDSIFVAHNVKFDANLLSEFLFLEGKYIQLLVLCAGLSLHMLYVIGTQDVNSAVNLKSNVQMYMLTFAVAPWHSMIWTPFQKEAFHSSTQYYIRSLPSHRGLPTVTFVRDDLALQPALCSHTNPGFHSSQHPVSSVIMPQPSLFSLFGEIFWVIENLKMLKGL